MTLIHEGLFGGYDFKRFSRAVRKVGLFRRQIIRQLYSGYVYPKLELYLKIQEEYRNG